ncbi:MAG: hypothetical protein J6S28_07250 [Clostridia bacterium]|nr:hypothetical protein [Clostridia bacterium]MBO7295857.1 hypothetical protein [Clostridia bacterium]
MAQKNQREFTLHMSEDMLRKFIFISEKEGRTPNNQFLFMLRNSVAYYEKTKGRISQADLAKIDLSAFEDEKGAENENG